MPYPTKKQIIQEIERIDRNRAGEYRYGVKFYFGKLEKYNKAKLLKILEAIKKP